MKKFERNYLFLVVLGGRADKANVELHDVRWVVGPKIEDTFKVLKKVCLDQLMVYISIALKK